MALSIVRNDITRMEVDAIVNATNERLTVGGFGVDASIHAAAGPELEAALAEIGFCATGSAVITDAFRISSCRYIIHTAGPVYRQREGLFAGRREAKNEALLRSCYRSVLSTAKEHGCRSVAMPLISAGTNGFPKETVYGIATSVAREFLLTQGETEEMMIYIVLYDNEAVEISGRLQDHIRHYISDHYRDEHEAELENFYAAKQSAPTVSMRRRREYLAEQAQWNRDERRKESSFPRESPPKAAMPPVMSGATASSMLEETMEMPMEKPGRGEDYREQDNSFAEMCEWWCERKHISKNEFYTRANITRAAFWNMKHNPEQVPRKTNVLACAVGLKLDLQETGDLLMRAGMVRSHYYKLDVIVEYFIREQNYDIDSINAMLFEEDQPLLGSVAR